jgi:hypothetical protein
MRICAVSDTDAMRAHMQIHEFAQQQMLLEEQKCSLEMECALLEHQKLSMQRQHNSLFRY